MPKDGELQRRARCAVALAPADAIMGVVGSGNAFAMIARAVVVGAGNVRGAPEVTVTASPPNTD